jgi:hypothetical protein
MAGRVALLNLARRLVSLSQSQAAGQRGKIVAGILGEDEMSAFGGIADIAVSKRHVCL